MRAFTFLPVLALAACTAGPDYEGPKTAGAATPQPGFVRADTTVRSDSPQPARWWRQLGDPLLDALEERALAADPNVALAEARVKQARASLRFERADRLPKGNASAVYVHAELPGIDLGGSGENGNGGGASDESESDTNALNFYNLGFDASWEIDLWGGRRRRVEAARAQLGAAEANRADAQVSLTAEVAQTYVSFRERQQRIQSLLASAAMQREILQLVEQRARQGASSALEVEQQRDALNQAQAAVPPVEMERDALLNALATLTGEVPGALDAMLHTPAPIPLPPANVAIGDPAAMLQRRPDLRAAERQLAKATAQIGIVEAARFPSVSFMGLIGIGGTHPEDMVDFDKLAALAVPRLSWNILEFGRGDARIKQANATREEAEARYRSAVLGALRDCEDALARFGAQRRAVASTARSSASAKRSAQLTQQRFDAGAASRVTMLQAQERSKATDRVAAQNTASLTNDFIALQKALGLGWQ